MASKDKQFRTEQVVKTWQGPKGVCTCGHVGDGCWSQHEGTLRLLQNGHGRCLESGCKCARFTFDRWTGNFVVALKEAGVWGI